MIFMEHANTDPFVEAFSGRFQNVLRWEQLEQLWEVLRHDVDNGWHIYAIGEQPPEEPVSAELLRTFLSEIDQLLRSEHAEDYCGIVYVDSLEAPAFVKIFDPNNLGVSCGYSDNPPLPGWILSRLPPVDLNSSTVLPGNRKRWWQRLLGA
jgi:hypothetical protein